MLNECGQCRADAALALESARRQRDFQAGQKDVLQKELREAEREQTETGLLLEDVEERLAGAQEALRKLNAELAGLPLEEPLAQVNYWGARVSVSERTVNDARARLNERGQAVERVKAQRERRPGRREAEVQAALTSLEAEKERLQADERVLQEQIEALRGQIEPAEAQLAQAEQEEAALQEREAAAQKLLANVERFHAQAQPELSRRQECPRAAAAENRGRFRPGAVRVRDQRDRAVPLPLGEMVETLPYVTALPPELEEALAQKRARDLGAWARSTWKPGRSMSRSRNAMIS